MRYSADNFTCNCPRKEFSSLAAQLSIQDNPTVQLSSFLSSRIKRLKHSLMLIIFIKQQVSLGIIETSEDNIADVLTKALLWREFARKAAKLLGIEE